MNIPQRDIITSAVLILYIVFFGTSPPAFVKTVMSNPIGASASFGLAIYVTLYHSKPVGALLIVALLTSMTRMTEHMTTPTCPAGYSYAGGSNSCIPNGGGDFICPSGNTKMVGRNGDRFCIPNERLQQAVSSGQATVDKSAPANPPATPPAKPPATPPAKPPATPPVDTTAKRLDEIEKDIAYLKTVGMTEKSDNETMKKLVAERKRLKPAPKPVMACNLENFAPF